MPERIGIREARPEDCDFVFALSNDDLVRSCSTHTERIAYADHVAWFSRMLRNPDVRFYVFETEAGTRAGQFRIERKAEGWVASMSLAKEFRGGGRASALCRMALRKSGLRKVWASTKAGNASALQVLRASGFQPVRDETVDGVAYHVLQFTDPVYIVAEMSANHRGDFGRAKEIIAAAKSAGADAVKLQTYTADTMTLDCRTPPFVIEGGTLWDGKTFFEVYHENETPWSWTPKLKDYADSLGIELFSTPFDRTAVDFLDACGVRKFKIASFEAVDIPLIRHAAAKGRPMFISTGICTPEEMQAAVDACFAEGNCDVTLLKCTSAYPAKLEDMNLQTVADMVGRFRPQGVRLGLSDHSLSTEPVVAATALGARVVEKHLCIDRPDGDAESRFSLLPNQFAEMVRAVRNVEKCLGEVTYAVNPVARAGRRSLFVAEDMAPGDVFTEENLRSVRPGMGCAPARTGDFLGRRAVRAIRKGTPMSEELVAEEGRG